MSSTCEACWLRSARCERPARAWPPASSALAWVPPPAISPAGGRCILVFAAILGAVFGRRLLVLHRRLDGGLLACLRFGRLAPPCLHSARRRRLSAGKDQDRLAQISVA